MNFGVRKLESRGYRAEILQVQNIPIVWRYLRDPTFSRFDTIPECDRHTHRHTTTAYTALSIASRGKNGSVEKNHAPFGVICHAFGKT